MKTYRIRITKMEEKLTATNEYQKISDTGGEDGKSKYGYVPTEKMMEKETEILDLTVENLVVKNVINSILTNSESK